MKCPKCGVDKDVLETWGERIEYKVDIISKKYIELVSSLESIRTENARLRECVSAGETLLNAPHCPMCGDTGTLSSFGELDIDPPDMCGWCHGREDSFFNRKQAYTRAREAGG